MAQSNDQLKFILPRTTDVDVISYLFDNIFSDFFFLLKVTNCTEWFDSYPLIGFNFSEWLYGGICPCL